MEISCDHYVDDDDKNFLLDDQNVKNRACEKHFCWINGNTVANSRANSSWPQNGNGTFLKIEDMPSSDDQIENLEDSPLLVNDCYGEPVESDFHCHDKLSNVEDGKAWRKLVLASLFCFLFMVAEVIGGYLAGSLAIMTDAAHLFSDFIGFLISLLAIWVGRKPATKYMTFGYHRAEVLGALLSVLTIWILAAVFSTLAINRIYKEDYEIDANTMIIIASLGLVVNIIMGAILHGFFHNHSHGLAPANASPEADNINVRAAAAHVLGDLLQSVGVLVAAVIIKIYPTAKMADPICTLVFSLIVICTTAKVGKDSIWFLIEGSPMNSEKIVTELKRLASIKHVHSIHVWSLAPGKNAVAVHLAVDKYCDRDLAIKKATSIIQSQISVISCTVQVEVYNPDFINACQQCQVMQC